MSDHLSTQLLEGYRQHRLAPAQLLALDDHLTTCAACRQKLRTINPTQAALLALQASLEEVAQEDTSHLPESQLQAYAQGQLDPLDRELTESHLDSCPTCSAQVRRLLSSTPPRFKPAAAASRAGQLWWRKLVTASGRSRGDRALPLALSFRVAAAVVLLLSLGIALVTWVRTHPDKSEQVAYPPPQPRLTPPGPAAPTLVALNDGGTQIVLDTQGKVRGLDSLSPADQQRVRQALTTQKLELPKTLQQLSDSSGTMMGPTTPTAFALLAPVGRVILSDRPILRWRPLPGAISYQVTLTDPTAGYREIAASPQLHDTSWRVQHGLQRGRLYAWQVTARTPSGEVKAPPPHAAEARFLILEQTQTDELARAEKTYAGKHLALALLYAEAGLLEQAEDELEALVAANPTSPVAKNLLRDLRTRGR